MFQSPRKFVTPFTKCVSDLNWRLTGLIIPLVLFITFFSLHYSSSTSSNGFSAFYPVQQFLFNLPFKFISEEDPVVSKDELLRSKIAVCLVGGARRFELTGPSIIEMVLKEYPNSDLFLHSPLDKDTFKFSILKFAPNVAAVRIFHPQPLPENEPYVRVLTAHNSPNGIQVISLLFSLIYLLLLFSLFGFLKTPLQNHIVKRIAYFVACFF